MQLNINPISYIELPLPMIFVVDTLYLILSFHEGMTQFFEIGVFSNKCFLMASTLAVPETYVSIVDGGWL